MLYDWIILYICLRFDAGTNIKTLVKPFYLVGCIPNGIRVFLFDKVMGTKKIQSLLLNHLKKRPDFNLLTTNYSWNLHFEADVYQVKKSGFTVEYEIKISRADFLKDFKKQKKRFNGINYDVIKKHDWLQSDILFKNSPQNRFKPNEFYFVFPSGMIGSDEIPKVYGIINILVSGQVITIRRPKKLHKEKLLTDKDLLEIARNFTLKQCSL